MRKSNHVAVREMLRGAPDGMTADDIGQHLGIDSCGIRRALDNMPDAYVDRWVKSRGVRLAAVWCVVVPPPNCPHPNA